MALGPNSIDKVMSPFPTPLHAVDGAESNPEEMQIVISDDEGNPVYGEPNEEENQPLDHNSNLAEHISEETLDEIASELVEEFERDKTSRDPWEKAYVKGIKLLGLEIEERTQPWEGACGVFHPILAEAVIRFQAESITETFPAAGPVLTSITGAETEERRKQALRVKNDMNYFTTEVMPEYRKEHEKLLLNLGLSGSGFKKIYFDPVINRPVSLFVPADDFIVSYGATDLRSCPRYTHVLKVYKNDIIKSIRSGVYREVELSDPSPQYSESEKQEQKNSGYEAKVEYDKRHTLLEMHVDYDLPGFEDTAQPEPNGEPGEQTGIALPYIITIEKDSKKVLSIYRNWKEADPTKQKEQFFVPYEYIPGLGFYGIGLIHLLGGIAKSATSILRQLTDAGTLANLPGGLKARGLRIKGDDSPIRPGEWRDVDLPAGSVKDNFLPLPYKEPSTVLFQLLGSMVEEGRTVASIADLKISDMNNQAPVGTTLAIIERGMKVMSAVNARVHESLKRELNILSGIIKEFSPPQYEYEVEEQNVSRKQDYSSGVDIIPVSNPNASTMAQRIMQYQAALQLSQTAPQIYNLQELHRQMIDVLGLANADKIVPSANDIKPADPVTENMNILTGKPVKAFQYQDHEAHIKVHMAAIDDPKIQALMQKSPQATSVAASAASHIQEHLAFEYRHQIEKQLGVSLPAPEEELPPEVEASLSKMVADAADKLLQKDKEEERNRKIAEEQGDPLIQMQKQEVAAKVAEVERKSQADRLRAATAEMQRLSNERIEGAKLGVQLATAKQQTQTDSSIAGAKIGADAMTKVIEIKNRNKQNSGQNKNT